MFLKKVILCGFKSFADRTEFEFGSGRTAIVGPNGCGKSNILDAIRWVLGEQSARTLRGKKMLDVIFAGSRTRKPANFAQVDLVFDNSSHFLACDEREVTVSRLLYRNGDSEYRLNGKRCRMRDIRELLLDTGVGVDAYSVIEQGKVDALLQASPIQRREIFEEAAGISRYRVRRAEAQRKLERTQNNLLRLNDVIEELERRLRSVKLAAGKARRFQEYDARLRELRSAFSLAEFHELEQALTQQRAQVQRCNEDLQARRAQLARLDADAAELQQVAQQLDEQIQQAEQTLRDLETEQSALVERISQGQRRLEELAQTRSGRQQFAARAAQQARELQERLGRQQEQLASLQQQAAEQQQHIEQLQLDYDQAAARLQQARQRLEQERTAAFEAARNSSRLHNEEQHLRQQIQQLETRRNGLLARRDEVRRQQDEARQRRGELTARLEELDQDSDRLAGELRERDGRLEELNSQLAQADNELAALKEQRSALDSRATLLEDLEKRQEGVGQGARWVLEWTDEHGQRAGGVLGLVADLLRIDDPRVDALAPVLAGFENHVVVREAHAFLSELARRGQQPGPVGVIALDRLSSSAGCIDFRNSPGFVAHALDWVRCEPEYRPLAQALLGRTVIVSDIERAMAMAASATSGYTFVTLDGQVVESGGRLTLGGRQGVAGLISRKAHLRQLQAELDEVETNLERATRRRQGLAAELGDLRLQREALLEQIATVQRQHAELRTELLRLDDEHARLERELAALESEIGELARALSQAAGRLSEVESQHAQASAVQQDHEQRIAAGEQELRDLQQRLEQASQQLTAARVEAGRSAERLAAAKRALDDDRQRLEQLQQQADAAQREAQETLERIEAAREEIARDTRRRGQLEQELATQRDVVVALRQQRQERRGELEACGAAVRDLHGEIERADQALREAELALRESEVRRENLIARVADELGVDLVALYRDYEHTDQDWQAIKDEIEELRGKIARLGNVNLDAITELEELTPRYENLTAQRDDLVESINRLEKLIAELDEESRTRFVACFEEVRVNFHELFRKLFGGGKADIILEDPEQPLECGIEIIARPPGKEPRSISLLSGGEKTMTAVALLFAIFKRKPSPFAILDEVDAALDESNIDRFNDMVNDFLAQSQFILITHSKRTMQTADVLYGITMEEPGVSKRVSVRFDDRVDTPHVA